MKIRVVLMRGATAKAGAKRRGRARALLREYDSPTPGERRLSRSPTNADIGMYRPDRSEARKAKRQRRERPGRHRSRYRVRNCVRNKLIERNAVRLRKFSSCFP